MCIVMLSRFSKTHQAFFASGANEVLGKINAQADAFYSYFSLKQVNRQLALENARLRNELKSSFVASDSSLVNGMDSVNLDSVMRYRKYQFFPARVVGNTVIYQNNYLTLERGSLQGVRAGMSVISPSGIVGVVIEVSPNYCRVMSLLHRSSRVSAMLKKNHSFGSVEWDGGDPSVLTLKNISKSTRVALGDTVVTSNYSANYPPGIMIGRVIGAVNDPSSNFYTLKIKSSTDFFRLEYVYLILNYHYAEQVKLENTKLRLNE